MSQSAGRAPGRSRREFLRKTAQACAAGFAFPTIVPGSALGLSGAVAPSNRITLGDHRHGQPGLQRHPLVPQGRSRADRRGLRRQPREPGLLGRQGRRPRAGPAAGRGALREATSRPGRIAAATPTSITARSSGRQDIDAVEICTPDHWHAIPVIEACKARKDIYCQKPLSLTIAEGRAMSYAVSKSKVVFQTGSQQRSDTELPPRLRAGPQRPDRRRCRRSASACPAGGPDYAKTGDHKKPEPVPEGFDYDLWLGPAPDAPYAPARCHVNFRWIYDYSGGQVTDWGGHHPDCAQWGMGTELTGPIEIRNAKGAFPPDPLWNTATEYSFEAVYENGVTMIISNKEKMGVTFEGTEGNDLRQPRQARGRPEVDPRLQDRPGRDPPLQERRPLPQLHRLRASRAGRRPPRSRSPTARSRSATWATSRCGWAASSCAGTRGPSGSSATTRPPRCSAGPIATPGSCRRYRGASRQRIKRRRNHEKHEITRKKTIGTPT